MPDHFNLALGGLIALAAALGTALLIWAIHPLLVRYALARPNARSSHKVPTPQGAGIAVVAIALVVAALAIFATNGPDQVFTVFGAAILLAIVGAVDDLRTVAVVPRLLLQAAAVAIVVIALPDSFRAIPALPLVAERALAFIAGLWLVNLVNFMDGLDWIMVAELVPITAALVLLGTMGEISSQTAIVAASLGGAMLGFAPFNKPVAKVFLGDVGSLPIGLLLGWLLIRLGEHHFAAALLLPLYYLADATITLLRRWRNGEALMTSHRSHFYQRALDGGMPVMTIIRHVVVLNVGLAGLAFATWLAPAVSVPAVLCGAALVGYVLFSFDRYAGSVARRRANSAD